MCVLQKAGGVPLSADEMLRVVNVAVERAKELDKFVENRLRTDWAGRNVEVQ
jgi:exosome complex component RRP45